MKILWMVLSSEKQKADPINSTITQRFFFQLPFGKLLTELKKAKNSVDTNAKL